jgi:phosphoribosylformylglycinamidine synthase subunit PurQ / glutaminase
MAAAQKTGAKVGVITFPGSNCDADLRRAITQTAGLSLVEIWHKEQGLDVDAVLLPGGFSYGDYLRSGAIARFSPIMESVIAFAQKGGPVLGVCNGFQILTEAGLLPGALLRNRDLQFLCQDVVLRVEGRETPFTRGLPGLARTYRIPIAHMDGNFTADKETLERLEGEGQVIFRYVGGAPNGAVRDIAGVSNPRGNVVGLMPHPERRVDADVGGTDGRAFFDSLAGWLALAAA